MGRSFVEIADECLYMVFQSLRIVPVGRAALPTPTTPDHAGFTRVTIRTMSDSLSAGTARISLDFPGKGGYNWPIFYQGGTHMQCARLKTYMETGRVVFLPARSIRPNPAQPRRSFDETALGELI